jgi:sugar O-acyltransferase (sialic acid O-acetyltransferase NeuD family)
VTRAVIFGTSGLGRLMYYYLTHDSPHDVVAFCIDAERITEREMFGLPIVAFEEVASLYPPEDHQMCVAVGVTRVNHLRAERFAQARSAGYGFVRYVSSRASVWPDLELGANSVVMEGAFVQPFARIGDDVTVGPGSAIGHHTTIGDHCFLGSRANISGDVVVDGYCFLGAGCTIRDGVRIAAECVIGAGIEILADTEPRGVYVTARAERLRLPSDKLPRL